MSIATMNWALQQRLASPLQQILLYVIADSASPAGVTRHCDPEYLVKHSRMSRATVFRRLGELRAFGLLQTFNEHGAHGEHIYEIRLDLTALVQVALKGERGGDDGPDDAEDAGVESHSETPAQSHSETQSSAVRPVQSHSCDRISPPLSKDSPQAPQGGVGETDQISDEVKKRFDYFFTSCLGWRTQTNRERPLAMFRLLTETEQIACAAASPVHAAELTKLKKKSLDAWKLIRDRFWTSYPDARLPEKPAEPVWISDGQQIAGLHALARIMDRALPRLVDDPERGSGLWRNAPVGLDLAALGIFALTDELDWEVVVPDTREFNAWRHRLHEWTGAWVEPRVVMRRGKKLLSMGPGNAPIEAQNRASGIPVPCRWPPKKDGTIYSDDAPAAQETNPENPHA